MSQPGRGHTVEFRIRAGADCRIAELFGARIHIIAIRVGRTGYLTNIILARPRFRSLLAYRPVRQRRIHGPTIDTRIHRTRIAVIRDIGRIFRFGSNPPRAKYGFTIRRRLKRIGSGNSIQHGVLTVFRGSTGPWSARIIVGRCIAGSIHLACRPNLDNLRAARFQQRKPTSPHGNNHQPCQTRSAHLPTPSHQTTAACPGTTSTSHGENPTKNISEFGALNAPCPKFTVPLNVPVTHDCPSRPAAMPYGVTTEPAEP